jgi:Protein of unknown function (DUF3592)
MANPYIVGACFLLLGIYVLFWVEKRHRIANEAASWPHVEGVVVESRVTHARPHMDENDFLSFVYRYEVANVQYAGSGIDIFELGSSMSTDEMESFALAYPEGSKVDVYYDVDHPSRSAISPASRTAYKRNRNFGIFLVCVGIVLLLAARKFQ